jgi:hypothetical protein
LQDYCGDRFGIRLDRLSRTVEVIELRNGSWQSHGVKWSYPFNRGLLESSKNPVTPWSFAWSDLRGRKPDEYETLTRVVLGSWPKNR